jgi:hypothetical protein
LAFIPYIQVRAFLQLGKNAGKDSIGVAVDVATDLMEKKDNPKVYIG